MSERLRCLRITRSKSWNGEPSGSPVFCNAPTYKRCRLAGDDGMGCANCRAFSREQERAANIADGGIGRRARQKRCRDNSRGFRVYGLFDPRDGCLRYVGKTVRGLNHRLDGHLSTVSSASRAKQTAASPWISELLLLGLRPEIQLIRSCESQEDLDRWEQTIICGLGKSGHDLLNYGLPWAAQQPLSLEEVMA